MFFLKVVGCLVVIAVVLGAAYWLLYIFAKGMSDDVS